MILVTGADGIVGRAVCAQFAMLGLDYRPLVRRVKEGITLPQAEIVDLAKIEEVNYSKFSNVSSIVHLAAAVPHSCYYPDTIDTANLTRRIDSSIFALKSKLEIPIIYMSTCGLYDRKLDRVKFEDDVEAINPESPYFLAKLEGEDLFLQGDNATVLRLSAPVGPGMKSSVVLSKFITSARKNIPIGLWGSGLREQNFIDVVDVVRLIVKVIANPMTTVLNVAADQPITMADLARVVVKVVGSGSFEYTGDVDPRDSEKSYYSIDRARDLYDWYPSIDIVSSCRNILSEVFENN